MSGAPHAHDYDVAVIGCGPTGATLAGLLGRAGLRVGVFEKSKTIYAAPRAVGFDHDAMRLFQRIGIADALAPHVSLFADSEYFGADGQIIQRNRRISPPYPLTWAPNYTCDQPGVEAVLRQALAAMPNVSVNLGRELVSAAETEGGTVFTVRDTAGTSREHSAAYLVGCDGASSALRRSIGSALDDLEYDEPWIVVDVKVNENHLARLPQTTVQYCEPARPCTYVICPGNHRRWEIMLLDGEPREGAVSEERLWKLLARWLKPGEGQIWRAAAYRFHALIARQWRKGRIFLAGDAAHQTPPFLGQGMCQGLRDAGNLAWKLELALRGRASAALLDTYAEERYPHVAATTKIAIQFGKVVSERDPARARERDARLLTKGGGAPLTLIRQELIPGLTAGLIASATQRAGTVFPQPLVTQLGMRGRSCLMDDLTPLSFRVVVGAGFDSPALHQAAAAHGIPVIVLHPSGTEANGPGLHICEQDSLLRDWFAAADCLGAVVRPDHYVYGTFSDSADGVALIEEMAERAFAPQPMNQ